MEEYRNLPKSASRPDQRDTLLTSKVRVEKAHAEDRYDDVFVDTQKSMAIYREWLAMTRPALAVCVAPCR